MMAHADKKSGTKSPEWWKHLRPENKRAFWKKVRKTVKEVLRGNKD
jgi:myo-inositol catabolism protein IolC